MSSDWQRNKLDHLIEIKHGFAFKGEFFSEKSTPYQLTTPGNFAVGGGFKPGKGKFYSGPFPDDYVLYARDLIVTMTDLSKAADTLGYSALVPETHGTTWLHNQRIGRVNVKPGAPVSRDFIHYLMRSPEYRHWVVSTATGSTVKHTSPTRICEYEFMLPPVLVQKEIAETLGALDDQIILLRESNETLEAITHAIFKSWFVDFDPVKAKTAGQVPGGIDEATAALFPDSFSDTTEGLIPSGWMHGTLKDMAELSAEAWSAKKHPETLSYLDLSDVKSNQISNPTDYAFDEAPSRARRVLKHGDTIVGTVRPGNRSYAFISNPVANLTGSTGFAVLRPKDPADKEFVYLSATQDPSIEHLAHIADGGAYPAVRPEAVAQLPCVLADRKVLSAFHDFCEPMLAAVADNQEEIKTLSELRDTLLPRLISGKLRIPETQEAVAEMA